MPMNITCEQVQGRVPITVLGIQGELDGSNFQQLIGRAQEVYGAGARHILVDMSEMTFMSSAGLVALHSIALLLAGQALPDYQNGWAAFHAVERTAETGSQGAVKLLKPRERVERTLRIAGMDTYLELYQDMAVAIDSF